MDNLTRPQWNVQEANKKRALLPALLAWKLLGGTKYYRGKRESVPLDATLFSLVQEKEEGFYSLLSASYKYLGTCLHLLSSASLPPFLFKSRVWLKKQPILPHAAADTGGRVCEGREPTAQRHKNVGCRVPGLNWKDPQKWACRLWTFLGTWVHFRDGGEWERVRHQALTPTKKEKKKPSWIPRPCCENGRFPLLPHASLLKVSNECQQFYF